MRPRATTISGHELTLRLWDHSNHDDDTRPAVLFLHGYLDTGRSYDDAVAQLTHVRALCLDWRGHGQSERAGAGGSYHLLDHAKDLSVVVDGLRARGVQLAAIVAHSMGANIAYMFAGARPEAVPRLLLLDGCGPPPEDPREQSDRLASVLASLKGSKKPFATVVDVDDAIAKLQAQNFGLPTEAAARMVRDVLVPADDDSARLAFPFDPRLRGPTPVRHPEETWLACAARMTMPVHVLRADNGYVPDDEPTTSRLRTMQNARMRSVPGGHHIHVEQPALLAEAVCTLLEEPLTP
jgi:pimeloyl-ACP methyl ester carboxylesterase